MDINNKNQINKGILKAVLKPKKKPLPQIKPLLQLQMKAPLIWKK